VLRTDRQTDRTSGLLCCTFCRLSSDEQLLANQKNLLDLVEAFLDAIINSLPGIPLQLRTVCHCLYTVSVLRVFVCLHLCVDFCYVTLAGGSQLISGHSTGHC